MYFTKELSRNFLSRNTLQEIFSGVFLAFILHVFWLLIIAFFDFPTVNFGIAFKLLLCPDKLDVLEMGKVTDKINDIAKYFISLGLFAATSAFILKSVVRMWNFDSRLAFLRFDNKWLYILSGEVLLQQRYANGNRGQSYIPPINVYVDVLTKGETEIIYQGYLEDYQMSDNFSIDYIVLAYPEKITFEIVKDPSGNVVSKTPKTRTIDSNHFVIPYSECVNINVRYNPKKGTSVQQLPQKNSPTLNSSDGKDTAIALEA